MSQKIKTALIWIFLVVTLAAMAWFKMTQPRILVLHSYASDYSWTRDIDIGLKRVLDERVNYKVQWYYMDTKNHPDEKFKRKAGIQARQAIEALNPDLIIAVDDDAQAYAAKYYAGRKDIAIIFAGINATVEPYGYRKVDIVTGIYERKPLLDLRRALSAMREPNGAELGRRIMHLGDRSSSVEADTKEIESFDWAPFSLVGSRKIDTFDEWKEVVTQLAGKADVLLVSNYHNIYQTAGKPMLVSPKDIMKWTEANSPVPVVGLGGFMVEDGGMFAVGASGFEQGEITARMAIQVLDGGAIPKTIPEAMPKQFLVYMRARLLNARHLVLPPIYEAFARASNNFYE